MARNDPSTALILALVGRDGAVAQRILTEVGIQAQTCADLTDMLDALPRAGCAVITIESLSAAERPALVEWAGRQPPWSDMPFILLSERGISPDAGLTEMLGNVTVLERPFHPTVLVSATRSALRARGRQREVEAHLHERQQAHERQALLIRELHHRVKNTLSTVQGLLGGTRRSSHSMDEFYQSFSDRIISLSKTHTLLTEDYWQTGSLIEILKAELGPYDSRPARRISLNGPHVELSSEYAIPIGMAIHELTTNAVKYGSLSTPAGRVDVTWDVELSDARKTLHFMWAEQGGPLVRKPQRRGFGSTLLQRVLTTQCSAKVRSDFEPQGLLFQMEATLAPDHSGEK